MASSNKFTYPEEVKPLLMETNDLIMGDGRVVTPAEIWGYMTSIAPIRYPYAFNNSISFGNRLSSDVYLISGIKEAYMEMTGTERVEAAEKKGTPIIMTQGGYTAEPYYAAGCIPVGPIFPRNWQMYLKKEDSFNDRNNRSMRFLNESRIHLDIECCNLIASVILLKNYSTPVDMVAPCVCSRCSDMAYAMSAYATGEKSAKGTDIPVHMMDYPVHNKSSPWRITYLEEELHTLTEKLGSLSGKVVTDEDLRVEIKTENKARQIIQECQKIWWDASIPPTNSKNNSFAHFGHRGSFDFTATIQVLEELKAEISERVKKGISGYGLAEDPVRLFVCGSCVNPNSAFVDAHGGVVVGKDDLWSTACSHVKESGDPFHNLAESFANLPYEQSTEERIQWTIEQVKNSRTDGVVFLYNWGCNYQSAISAMVADTIRDEAGIPAVNIEVGELTRLETLEQSQNRIESFLEILK